MSLIDWLNTNKKPQMDFVEWVKDIEVTQDDFGRILNISIINLIMDIIKNNIEEKIIPVCSFDQKLKTIFIYTKKEWRIVEKGEFYRFIDNIIRKLTGQLNHWIQNNNLQNSEEQFHMYTRKIYAFDTEEVSHRVHLRLYNHIKYNLRNIVEYEFSFLERLRLTVLCFLRFLRLTVFFLVRFLERPVSKYNISFFNLLTGITNL